MPNSSVAAGIVVGAMLGISSVLPAQTSNRGSTAHFRLGIAFGATVPNGYALSLPTDLGPHVQLGGGWYGTSRLAIRVDALAQMLSGAAVEPSCVPGGACRGYALHPNQVYSLSVSAEVRPIAAMPRVFAVLGAGAYHARGPEATNFGTTAGASGGLGVDLGEARGRGLTLEARYHYLPNDFGLLTGMLTPSIGFRF